MLYRTYESFNKSIDLRQTAWLYFLHIVYNGELLIKSWSKDNRMGVNCNDSMIELKSKGFVEIDDQYYRSTEKAYDKIFEVFGSTDMKSAFDRAIELESYQMDKNDLKGYDVNMIPVKVWLYNNEEFEEALDAWDDGFFTKWWNTMGSDKVLNSWLRKVGKEMNKRINEYHLRRYYYPLQLPENIQLFRGIKEEYKPEHKKKYTSWTLDEAQGKRFATYHFSQGYTARPHEAKIQTLLEAHVHLEDIVMFVGGDEHEVILLEPVEIEKIRRLN